MKTIAQLLDLTGKVAIVTGGAKGIGQGIVNRLAEAGALVVVADLDGAAAVETAHALTAKGLKAEALKIDVGSEAEIRTMIADTESQHGAVDIMVNNAGIYPNVTITDIDTDLFDTVLRVNLRSVFLTTKYAAETMRRHGGGTIINVTSIDALHPSMVGLAHYDASKHGAWGFTKNAALEYAKDGIRVNAIAPGGITTPGTAIMTDPGADTSGMIEAFLSKIPMHRMGEPDEIGMVALFLASDMASYITGSQLVVDGGALLS